MTRAVRKQPHIVLADNTELVGVTVSYLLNRFYPEGTLSVVTNGIEVLMTHAQHPANLILTDYLMPPLGGFELLQTLRSRGDMTPVIVLSNDPATAIRVAHAREAFWLQKPFSIMQLHQIIQSLFPIRTVQLP